MDVHVACMWLAGRRAHLGVMSACLEPQVRLQPLTDAAVSELLQVGSAHEVGHVAQDADLHHGREAVRLAHAPAAL